MPCMERCACWCRCCWDRALQAAEVGPEQRMGRTLCDLGPATDPSRPPSSHPCSGGDESYPAGLWGRLNEGLEVRSADVLKR